MKLTMLMNIAVGVGEHKANISWDDTARETRWLERHHLSIASAQENGGMALIPYLLGLPTYTTI